MKKLGTILAGMVNAKNSDRPALFKRQMLFLILAMSALPAFSQINYSTTFPNLGTWTISGNGGFSASGCATPGSIYMTRNSGSVSGEMSSAVGVSNGGNATLTYQYKVVNTTGGGATPANFGRFEIQIYNGTLSSWVTLQIVGVGGDAHTPSTSCVTKTVNFTPLSGNVSLRVVSYWNSGAYNIHLDDVSIVQGAALTAVPGCATGFSPANGAVNITTPPRLSWAPTPDAQRYNVHFGTSANPPLVSSNVYSTWYDITSSLLPNTTYYWRAVPRNNVGTASPCATISFQTGPIPVYCSPTYATGCNDIDIISNVTLGTLNNASSCGGYTFYQNATIPTIIQGQTANISLTVGNDPTQFLGGWIDFNQNGQFESSEGVVSTVTTAANGTTVLQLTVPVDAVTGQTRLRVRGGDDVAMTTSQACGATNSAFGETEDYIVNISCPSPVTYYADADEDGFGDAGNAQLACVQPTGFVTNDDDCDDTQVTFEDLDGDGYGSTIKIPCGTILNDIDCDDNAILYEDFDGDGYGTLTTVACGVSNSMDCNDANAAVPNATEIGYNLIDDDCDGSIDEGFAPITTVVQTPFCNATLPLINSQINANLISGAQGYRWRVTTMSGPNMGQQQEIDTQLRAMKLTQLQNYAFGTQYKIEVAVYYAGFLQPFTASNCIVTSPSPTTTLSICPQTLTAMSNVIYATMIPYVNGYRFRITDPSNVGNTQTIERNLREFRMNLITDFQVDYNKTYNVEVSLKNTDGTWLPFGSICNVTTPPFPATSLQDSQCDDYQVPSANTQIYAYSVPGAIAYVFQITGSGLVSPLTVTKSLRAFTLNDFAGQLLPGATYNVRVRPVFNLSDPAGPYTKTCTIVTPGLSRPAMAKDAFDAIAYPNPFVESFSIELKSMPAANVKVYDMTGRLLQEAVIKAEDPSQFGQSLPSGVYNVIVSDGDDSKVLRVVKR